MSERVLFCLYFMTALGFFFSVELPLLASVEW